MAKASPATFASAKRRAFRALAQQQPDGFVPDRIMFFNDDHGFIIRLSNLSDDHHVQRMVTWTEVDGTDIIALHVSTGVEMLARAQGENI